MNNITEQKRIETYRSAEEHIQALYNNEALGEKLGNLYTQYGLAAEKKQFIDVIGDTILGFYKVSDLPNTLQKNAGVGADAALRITSELLEFLAPVTQREEDQKATAAGAPIPTEVQNDPQVVEGDTQLEKVAPIHTMEGDINRIHGYGAFNAPNQSSDTPMQTTSQENTLVQTPRLDKQESEKSLNDSDSPS